MCRDTPRRHAEQYHADKKYKEAVAVAVEECADDTKGQTCYICTEAVHWKTKEGLVRMCACRGTAGFAHVSCLVEQAKILYAEGEENNLDSIARHARWQRWRTCRLCEQKYHGVVLHALGWACWKTYLGRPETNWARGSAMTELSFGLNEVKEYSDQLRVLQALLTIEERIGHGESSILITKSNLANALAHLGRIQECLEIERDVLARSKELRGVSNESTLISALNLADTLIDVKQFAEAKQILRETIPVSRTSMGTEHDLTLVLRVSYGDALYKDDASSRSDLAEAVTVLDDVTRISRRVYGTQHPETRNNEACLREAREALARAED